MKNKLVLAITTGCLLTHPIYSEYDFSEPEDKNRTGKSDQTEISSGNKSYIMTTDELLARAEDKFLSGYYEEAKTDVLKAIRITSNSDVKRKAFELMDKIDEKLNNDYSEIRNWSGPRIGAVGIIDEDSRNALADFGADFPVVSAFGWQFEYRFISGRPDEKVAGLIIFAPFILGIDQSAPMLSLNALIGLRLSSEFEFAVGPHALITPVDPFFHVGIVIAVGQNFKAAKLNFPLNIAAVLGKDMIRVGVFFGFNTVNKKY